MQFADEQIEQVEVAAVEKKIDESQHGSGADHSSTQVGQPHNGLYDPHGDKVQAGEGGDHRIPLAEFPLAVFLSLWDVKYLVHIGLPLLSGHSGEDEAGDEKVDAAQSREDVAFKFLHCSPSINLKLKSIQG